MLGVTVYALDECKLDHMVQQAPRQHDSAALQQFAEACEAIHTGRVTHCGLTGEPVIVLLSCAAQLVHTLIILVPIGWISLISRAHPTATPTRPVGPAQVCISPVHGPCQTLSCLFDGSATPAHHHSSMTYYALQYM